MAKNKATENTKVTRKPRKATFERIEDQGVVTFLPVNKRAQAFATELKAKVLTKAQLKKVAKKFRVYQYTSAGLRPIGLK